MNAWTRRWAAWWAASVLTLVAIVSLGDMPFQWRGSRGWEPGSAYCRLYDAKRLVTIEGTVQRVEKVYPMKGMGEGFHLILKTSSESIPVHLGPAWYVETQGLQVRSGDKVSVTGSRVSCDGKPVILAATVTRGDQVAKFRELSGAPGWVRRR